MGLFYFSCVSCFALIYMFKFPNLKELSVCSMKLTFQIWWLSPPGQFLSAVWSAPDARSALWAYLVPQTLLPKPENTHLKHQIYTVNVTQGKLPHTHNMSLTLSMESERHFLWRKRVTSWTRLSNVLLGRLDSSLNLSHRLNWKVIFENTGHQIERL